jgi:hypothetical protein
MTRRSPNLTTKLASALMEIRYLRGEISDRTAYAHQPAKEFVGQWDFDHIVFHTWGGADHFSNLRPMLRHDHRAKTKRDVKEIAKVRRGLRKRAGQKRKSKPIPGSRDTRFKKKLNGQVEIRT